ncbi:MAG: serine/threonine protein kinase, partial [Solirubrobacterales bacterium]
MEDGLWGIDVRIRPSEGERVIGGCYRVVQPLKPGPGWETLLAIDLAQGDRVTVKTISVEVISAGEVAQLEHDAEALRCVRGPWVAGLRRLGREDDRLLFVTPYIPGVSLQERLAEEPLSVVETLVVGRCLLAGLREVHGLGTLHRAIKPANIIIDEGKPLRRAVLTDFSLAPAVRLTASMRDRLVATARYVSPEQAGLLDFEVGERSDLYSVGAVLFECLAGRPLFPGDG